MHARAEVSISFKSRRLADSIAKSLSPEANHPAGTKSRVRVRVQQRRLDITFLARDVTALRATMNSYLRIITASLRVTEALANN